MSINRNETILGITGLQKYYGKNHVLKGIDLNIHRGEVVAIIGQSGSGKSTLLRCMNGLEEYQEGQIIYNGELTITSDPADAQEISRSIGMIFQQFNLFPHLTAIQNVMLAPQLVLGLSIMESHILAEQMLVKVGLGDRCDFYPSGLSGGQQQGVAIARQLLDYKASRPDTPYCYDVVTQEALQIGNSDTVGFIRKLPTHLVEAFKATLEELTYADVLLHVIDIANPEWEEQARVVDSLIRQLGAEDTPCIRVFNKCDAYIGILPHGENIVCISARSGEGAKELVDTLSAMLDRGKKRVMLKIPYANAGLADSLNREAQVHSMEYTDSGIEAEVTVGPELFGRVKQFIPGYVEPKEDWED